MLVASVASAVLAGGAAVATRRSVREQQNKPDPAADILAAAPRVDRAYSVAAEDGVGLHVEEVGAPDAPLTVVFVHGWTCTQEAWVYQRRALAADGVRLVFYDQRGHGRSGRPDTSAAGVEILGRDLRRVLEAARAPGNVVLVGHSLGGMTILALAAQFPELFAGRDESGPITGVALLSTSSGKLGALTLGLPSLVGRAAQAALPVSYRTLERFGDRLDKRRRGGGTISWMLTKHLGYGGDVPPSLVELMERMMRQTPLSMFAGFGTALLGLDLQAALPVLGGTHSTVIVGDADLLTPVDHSRALAEAIHGARFVVVPGGGHLVMLERPDLVDLHLRELFRRATGSPTGS